MIQLGDDCVKDIEFMLENASNKANTLCKNCYPCGKLKLGGWIHYQVTSVEELQEVLNFVYIKKKLKQKNAIDTQKQPISAAFSLH